MRLDDLHQHLPPRLLHAAGDGLAIPVLVASIFAGADWKGVLSTVAAVIISIGYIARLFLARMRLREDINGLGGSLREHNKKQDADIEELKKRLADLEGKK